MILTNTKYEDIGSELHVFLCNIDENYCLLIGGGDTQSAPFVYGWFLRQVIAALLMMENTSIYGENI